MFKLASSTMLKPVNNHVQAGQLNHVQASQFNHVQAGQLNHVQVCQQAKTSCAFLRVYNGFIGDDFQMRPNRCQLRNVI